MPVHYLSRLVTPQKKSFKLGTSANSSSKPEVLVANISDCKVESEKVVCLYSTGVGIKEWTQVKISAEGGSGYRYLNFAGDTIVATPAGKKYASELSLGDSVFGVISDVQFSEEQMELVRGTCLGDGSLRQVSNGKAMLRIGHGLKQAPYMAWKHSSLSPLSKRIVKMGNGNGFDTYASAQLSELKTHLYYGKNRIVTPDYARGLTARSIAAWFLDDGNLSGSYSRWGNGKSVIACFAIKDYSHKVILADAIERTCGAKPTLCKAGFMFSGDTNRSFQEAIAPYIHPSMQYKIVPRFQRPFDWNIQPESNQLIKHLRLVPLQVAGVRPMAQNRMTKGFSFKVPSGNPALLDYIAVYGEE